MSKFTCSGISRSFRNFRLDNVSFSMESGYFYVLVGVNGSGKTTLLSCISGITDRFTGDAQINGISLKRAPVEYRQKLGYISDMHPFFLDRSLLENGALFGCFYPGWSAGDYLSFLERFGLDPSRSAGELSKGESMKLQAAFALSHHPEFLFLDEPLDGFDPVFRRSFLALLQELLEQDIGILLSTHITEDMDRLADYLLIMENGKLSKCDTTEQLNDDYTDITGKSARHIRDLLELEHRGGAQ